MRRAGNVTLAIAFVAIVAVGAVALHVPDPAISPTLAQRQPDPAHGKYVAILGDCAACHTAPDRKPYAGGLPFPTPVGTIYSSNITPDAETGIGSFSFEDFVRVMRFGVRPDGTRLYPAMPYTAFAKVSDEDLQDLFAYLKSGLDSAHESPPESPIKWPFSMRWPLALWDAAFHDDSHFASDPSKDAKQNRGAYLVQGLGHCGTCHTPRGIAFQEEDVSGKSDIYLSGTPFNGASPINLRGNPGDGLGRWSADDIVALLKAGRNAHSAITGPMSEVVRDSTQFITDEDLAAIAAYLKSLPPAPETGRATFAANDAILHAILAGDEKSIGGRIYMDSCSACHRLSGSGQNLAFPTLAGNATVLTTDPASLIAVILNGARLPSTDAARTGLAMPGFAWRYDDSDVAELATFVRTSWGNGAAPVTAAEVAAVRRMGGFVRADQQN